jgi:hypothetical protein
MAAEIVPRDLAPGEMLEDGWREGMPIGSLITWEEVNKHGC